MEIVSANPSTGSWFLPELNPYPYKNSLSLLSISNFTSCNSPSLCFGLLTSKFIHANLEKKNEIIWLVISYAAFFST